MLKLIEHLKRLLASEQMIYDLVKTEIQEIKQKYGDERRTEIVHGASTDFEVEDLIADMAAGFSRLRAA